MMGQARVGSSAEVATSIIFIDIDASHDVSLLGFRQCSK
jgi:hypothetical protein